MHGYKRSKACSSALIQLFLYCFRQHTQFLNSEGKYGIVPGPHIVAIQPWSASISGTSHSYRASRDSRSKLGAFPGQSDARKPGGSCRGASPHSHRETIIPFHWTTTDRAQDGTPMA